ncbi:MAG: hypothetical protein MJ232_00305 [archaeon]|nr:hypothetical protein [Bacilli bacterium]MCQ2976444.1 hypothetical protein [archaeon]
MIIEEVCERLLIPNEEIFLKTISNNFNNFRPYFINKNTEKSRLVFVPKNLTKLCQKFILENYLLTLRCSDNVLSYRKNFSIIDNAKRHKGNHYFLHLDIKHYFNRMKWDMFKEILFKNFPNSKITRCLSIEKDEKFLKNILCFNGYIVQGSVSSPYISNLYLLEVDRYIVKNILPSIPNGIYTRYSDDIYISSSKYIAHSIIDLIGEKLSFYGLKFNYSKIDYKKLKDSVRITGITLTKNKKLTVCTSFKKNLKSDIYKCIKHNGVGTNFNSLFGKLSYLKSVDLEYYKSIDKKYKGDNTSLIERLTNIKRN